MTKLDSMLRNRDTTLLTKVHIVKAVVFPVVMYRCESLTIKRAEHQRTDAFKVGAGELMLEKTLESPLDCKELQPVHPKRNQSWLFFGRADAEAEAPILWFLMWRTDSWKRPWCWERLKAEEKGMTEDAIVGWHHWLNEHEFEQVLRVGDGQGGLVCCSPWGHKELNWTTELNLTEYQWG